RTLGSTQVPVQARELFVAAAASELDLEVSYPGALRPGQEAEVQITVTNRHDSPIQDIAVRSAQWSLDAGTLEPGESRSFTRKIRAEDHSDFAGKGVEISASGLADNQPLYDQARLKMDVINPALSAKVSHLRGPRTRYNLTNDGDDTLQRLKVVDDRGRVLGILSTLSPGQTESLILNGSASKVTVSAMDSSGQPVAGDVSLARPQLAFGGGSQSSSQPGALDEQLEGQKGVGQEGVEQLEQTEEEAAQDGKLVMMEAVASGSGGSDGPEEVTAKDSPASSSMGEIHGRIQSPAQIPPAGQDIPLAATSADREPAAQQSGFNLTIEADRTEVAPGDRVQFRAVAENSLDQVLSNVELTCGGKTTTTSFLSPGKGAKLEGELVANDSLDLTATASATDVKGNLRSSTTTLRIWKVSPQLSLEARASPQKAHFGQPVQITAILHNAGDRPVADILVQDRLGEVGRVALLEPGASATLERTAPLYEPADDLIQAVGSDGQEEVYASDRLDLQLYSAKMQLSVEPSEVVAYSGEQVEIFWVLGNQGEEPLNNVTLSGEGLGKCRLKEVAPSTSLRMAAVYTASRSTPVEVVAQGYGSSGQVVTESQSISIRSISPSVSLKVNPSTIEAGVGDAVNLSCLITNTGDDLLRDVVLTEKGQGVLARMDEIPAGDFQMATPQIVLSDNGTLQFEVRALDSRGKTWSDSVQVPVSVMEAALFLKVDSFPSEATAGEKVTVTSIVKNTGTVPLFNIFVISQTFGPLGTVDLLSPRSYRVLRAEVTVNNSVTDLVAAQGFTADKTPVIDRRKLQITTTPTPAARTPSGLDREPAASPEDSAVLYVSNASPGGSTYVASPPESSDAPAAVSQDKKDSPATSSQSPSPRPAPVPATSLQIEDGDGKGSYTSGISRLIDYITSILKGEDPARETTPLTDLSEQALQSNRGNQTLGIAGMTNPAGSHVKILNVMANPPEPAAGSPVKVVIHARSDLGITSTRVEWGIAEVSPAQNDILDVKRTSAIPMTLQSGTKQDGYWSCLVPGQLVGTFAALTIKVSDGAGEVEDGPYLVQWISRDLAREREQASQREEPQMGASREAMALDKSGKAPENGMLFIESSSVSGVGEVSIRDTFQESTMNYEQDLKGFGAIDMETERCLVKGNPMVNFSEINDLSFGEGTLKGFKRFNSPAFHGGMGASVTERFNLSQVDKSEIGMMRSVNHTQNTIAFSTEQAFQGMMNTRTEYARFNKKMKADQKLTGTFQTQKNVKFED
ncbi:MAG: hypothetical protein GKC10_08895, partial [Methanosarcinales archaeon]|nr:hypothetical protein [Methanosarcinales archaeon]